jgi:hypothetical protein
MREKLLGDYKYNNTISKVIQQINTKKIQKEKENEDQGTFLYDRYRSDKSYNSASRIPGPNIFFAGPMNGGKVIRPGSVESPISARKAARESGDKILVERSMALPNKSPLGEDKSEELKIQAKPLPTRDGN